MTKMTIMTKNDKMTKKKTNKAPERQREWPAFKYFSISGFNYFLPLNNLVDRYGFIAKLIIHTYAYII